MPDALTQDFRDINRLELIQQLEAKALVLVRRWVLQCEIFDRSLAVRLAGQKEDLRKQINTLRRLWYRETLLTAKDVAQLTWPPMVFARPEKPVKVLADIQTEIDHLQGLRFRDVSLMRLEAQGYRSHLE